MKKIFYKIGTVLLMMVFVMSVGGVVFAQEKTTSSNVPNLEPKTGSNVPSQIFTLQNPLKVNSVGELIQVLIEIFSYVAILFAVLMFIYIGFQYVTNAAQGNASRIKELHNQLMWLIVGVAIVIGARVMIQIVINTLSATGVVDSGIIQSANKANQGR